MIIIHLVVYQVNDFYQQMISNRIYFKQMNKLHVFVYCGGSIVTYYMYRLIIISMIYNSDPGLILFVAILFGLFLIIPMGYGILGLILVILMSIYGYSERQVYLTNINYNVSVSNITSQNGNYFIFNDGQYEPPSRCKLITKFINKYYRCVIKVVDFNHTFAFWFGRKCISKKCFNDVFPRHGKIGNPQRYPKLLNRTNSIIEDENGIDYLNTYNKIASHTFIGIEVMFYVYLVVSIIVVILVIVKDIRFIHSL
jgi:hypothetical protein